ncbi:MULTISPECIES: DUF6932 family protein [unclassified Acinetobacter]|uniref:DUF6932 family protein n=1 Tax=unclassified Acinetobacter TaxID=196816 RepID=UPI00190C9AF9|nr:MULTISPECIES: hypothetical protein [unclassified Acinetobacter]MBK0062180.1 hypothetical protein [Acinetobacter sp. S55]MBK0065984.1 hypothetical protein [Acinetobacter sp. S54]
MILIPKFNSSGVIPPIRPGELGHSNDRSPYVVDIIEIISHFATSNKRISILKGFLEYRYEIYQQHVTRGFQWIDGSFCQNVEMIENRDPNDMDVVTFFYLPEFPNNEITSEFIQEFSKLIDTKYTKPLFQVDAYGMQLGSEFVDYTAKMLSYWYSMWSHRKSDNMWKGFLQVPLSPNEDSAAFFLLTEIEKELV